MTAHKLARADTSLASPHFFISILDCVGGTIVFEMKLSYFCKEKKFEYTIFQYNIFIFDSLTNIIRSID